MDIEKIKERMCDEYCNKPLEAYATNKDADAAEEELMRICEGCPLNELEEEEEGIWISLGHVRGPLSHPYSETFKCSICGYEQYTLFMNPPNKCPHCKANMKMQEVFG